MEEDHKLVKWVADFVTNPDQPVDDALKRRFVLLDDQSRTRELQAMTSWFQDDCSIRQKAQIMKIGRELNHIHTALRKCGR